LVSETAGIAGTAGDESEPDEDEGEEQPGVVRADQGPGGERRPRRRGRRGGRRRRGGPEDGLAGSIADELGPTPVSEATDAVADFDGYSGEPSLPVVQPESILPAVQPEAIAPPPERQPADYGQQDQQEASRPSVQEDTAQEAERAARRRSTVREKVSFLVEARPDPAPAPVDHSPPAVRGSCPGKASLSPRQQMMASRAIRMYLPLAWHDARDPEQQTARQAGRFFLFRRNQKLNCGVHS
jgi:ribonuclease E